MIRFWSIGLVVLGWVGSGVPAAGQEKDAPEKVVLDLGGGVKMEFVKIKAGNFIMGSREWDPDEQPPHPVTISADYWLQTTETTQAQWKAIMGNTCPPYFNGAELPMENVSWEDCQEYLKKLNVKAKEQLKQRVAKLPTEAQWEYACRAGNKGAWCFGDDEKMLGDYAWYHDNSGNKTHPVGGKKPNQWGLQDMHGNVSEWCEDWYGKYGSEAAADPSGPAEGTKRCLRGGEYGSYIDSGTRSAERSKNDPTARDDPYFTGLRVALR